MMPAHRWIRGVVEFERIGADGEGCGKLHEPGMNEHSLTLGSKTRLKNARLALWLLLPLAFSSMVGLLLLAL
jgi:hypothetical protein